jgi:hypothetical protein
VIASLLMIMTAYEMLWAMATEDHPELKAEYRLVEDIDPRVTPVSPAYNKHYISGDFDGDRVADYAFVVTAVGSQGHCVLVLLTRGKGSKVVKVVCGTEGRPGAVTLALGDTANRPRRDTLVVTPEEAPPSRFAWSSPPEAFREIQPR